MGKVIAALAVVCVALAVTTSAATTASPWASIEATIDDLTKTLNQINQQISQQDVKMNDYKSSITNIQNSMKSHRASIDAIKASINGINAKSHAQDLSLRNHAHNITKFSGQLKGFESKLNHDDAVLKNLSRDAKEHTMKLSSAQTSVNTQESKINQHELKLNEDAQKITKLDTDMRSEDGLLNSSLTLLNKVTSLVSNNSQKLTNEEHNVEAIARQLMQQQTFVEEKIRSDGMSGIKSLRHAREGTRNYYGDHYIGGSALSAHDHADYDRTIGLGEFVAVMNGIDFRTRHNDYKFRMPSHTRNYNEIVDVPFPSVPPQVTSKKTLDEQIVEMRAWFKAFKDQDHSVRDYRKYFKPNLCYLEGGWTLNAKTLSEPFQSDRHHIDAQSWFDLQEKIRFSSYGGSKSNLENFAYLPTTMYNFTDGIPQLAQWNYRILCHPLKQDVPTSYFTLQDDLAPRLSRKIAWDRIGSQRAARFRINEFGTDRAATYTLLDKLMHEIPGKNNYGANITDNAFGMRFYDASDKTESVPLNAAYYHRWYKLLQKGAMGLQVNHRGFRDENLWVAKTTQPNIMPLTLKHCSRGHCEYETTRVTYAIPLEIIYTTPLQSWNPLDLELHEEVKVSKNGRNGEQTSAKAFNGTSFRHYYRTPVEFYSSGGTERDAADTARGAVGVLDRHGQMKKAAPTGFRIMTPKIQDVGVVRIRYPIFPAHSEGSPLGEELGALKEMVMRMSRNAYLYEEAPLGQNTTQAADQDVEFHVWDSYKTPPGLHGHDITLTAAEYKSLMAGNDVTVTTSYNLGHNHDMVMYYNTGAQRFYYRKCDGQTRCWDAHPTRIVKQR